MHSMWVSNIFADTENPFIVEHFQLRKQIFVDQMGWHLNTCEIGEVDQYDTPLAKYCLTVANGKLVASARLLPMDRELGPNSYMIRDAALGRLSPYLPPQICLGFDTPLDGHAWEATRLTVAPCLTKLEKKAALSQTISKMIQQARIAGIKRMVAIGGLELYLGARSSGHPISRKTDYYATTSGKIAVFELPIIHF